MSKKKKKLNKRLIEERLRELETETRFRATKPAQAQETTPEKKIKTNREKKREPEAEKNGADQIIKNDVKKVALTLMAVIIIFTALYLVDQKTNLILNLSAKIFALLHVGI